MQKIVFNTRKIIWLITFVGAIFLCFSLVKLIESENFKNHTGSVRAIKFPFQKQLIPNEKESIGNEIKEGLVFLDWDVLSKVTHPKSQIRLFSKGKEHPLLVTQYVEESSNDDSSLRRIPAKLLSFKEEKDGSARIVLLQRKLRKNSSLKEIAAISIDTDAKNFDKFVSIYNSNGKILGEGAFFDYSSRIPLRNDLIKLSQSCNEEKIIVVISNYQERSKSPFERMVLGENGSKKVISSIISKKPKINKVVLYYREKASKVKTTLYPTNITLATQERNKQIIQLARHPYFVHTVEITSKTPRYFRQVRVKSGHKVIGHGNIWQLSNQDKGINIFVKDKTIGDNPWVIEIENNDNPPLEDVKIRLFGDQLCVRFYQSEDLILGYGGKRGANAAYDLALTLNKKMPNKPTHTLGKEIRNLGEKPIYVDSSRKVFSIVFYTFFLVFIPLFVYFFIKYKLNKKKKYRQIGNRIIIDSDEEEDDEDKSW